MSGITLSASVRQNLLSLQSTAALLATTQNDLATGNKVNSALDNPTEFFTAQGLNNRASDISNLLDGIANGVQVLQAANTGITSLQSYISSAQSIANQVLQAPTGYSTKSNVVSAGISGATADNLLGGSAATSATVTEGAFTTLNVSGAGNATAGSITGGSFTALDLSGTGASVSFDLAVDGGTAKTITLDSADVTAYTSAGGTLAGSLSGLTAADVANIVNYEYAGSPATGAATVTGPASVSGGNLVFASSTTGTSSSVAITNYATAGTVTDTSGLPTSDTTKQGTDGSTAGTIAGGAFTALDLTGTGASISFKVALDGGTAQTVTLDAAQVTAFTGAGGTLSGSNGTTPSALTAGDVAKLIDYQLDPTDTTGAGPATVNGSGELQITSTTTGASSSVAITNYTTAGTVTDTTGLPITDTTHNGTAAVAADDVSFTLTVDGGTAKNINISKAAVDTYNAAHTTATLNASSLSASDVAKLINYQVDNTGATTIASVSTGGNLVFTSTTTGTTSSIAVGTVTSSVTAGSSGVTATTAAATGAASTGLSGETLTIAATNSSTTATNITFGTAAGQVSTLNELNDALAANDLQASIDSSTGAITITTTNNAASQTVGAIGGTATATGQAFAAVTAGGQAPVADPNSQATRASLVAQYNQVLQQINTTAQDSSFNGINLLNGDTLNLTFDETGASKLSVTGVTFNTTGLGLSTLAAGTDFLDSNSANNVLSKLTQASTTLRTEASALGSNLSVVQIRQDFNKNLINVLQTGASNLTLADPNEEAANSQALSTRQSIAVSALALANQSQQSVLQLLR
ncbi:MAG TPA: flagellin [Bradyrhizobium sp.]|nr:flagellin [Bradyrhizobium sp.]